MRTPQREPCALCVGFVQRPRNLFPQDVYHTRSPQGKRRCYSPSQRECKEVILEVRLSGGNLEFANPIPRGLLLATTNFPQPLDQLVEEQRFSHRNRSRCLQHTTLCRKTGKYTFHSRTAILAIGRSWRTGEIGQHPPYIGRTAQHMTPMFVRWIMPCVRCLPMGTRLK